jgi:hypothetical protein
VAYQTQNKRMKFKLQSEEQTLLFAANPHLSESELIKLNELLLEINDWEVFAKQIDELGLSSLVYKNFIHLSDRSIIPEGIMVHLKKRYINLYLSNVQKHKDLENVIKHCNQNNIPIIPLKGIPLIHFIYKDYGLRSMSDIDLLVNDEDVEKFKHLLLENGWEIDNSKEISEFVTQINDSQHPYTFVKGLTKIELHNKLHSGLTSYQVDLKKYWSNASEIDLLQGKVYDLSPTDFLQYLCFHLHKHLIDERDVSMKHFIDIKSFIKNNESEIEWKKLVSSSCQYNCQVEIRDVLELCRDYFETTIPDEVFHLLKGQSKYDPHFLFIHYLRNDNKAIEEFVLTRHDNYKMTFSKINGTKRKLKYLFDLFIPPKKFMIKRYAIKNKNLIFYFYIKRIFVGITKGISKKNS